MKTLSLLLPWGQGVGASVIGEAGKGAPSLLSESGL
jgi:hypothetical protein